MQGLLWGPFNRLGQAPVTVVNMAIIPFPWPCPWVVFKDSANTVLRFLDWNYSRTGLGQWTVSNLRNLIPV